MENHPPRLECHRWCPTVEALLLEYLSECYCSSFNVGVQARPLKIVQARCPDETATVEKCHAGAPLEECHCGEVSRRSATRGGHLGGVSHRGATHGSIAVSRRNATGSSTKVSCRSATCRGAIAEPSRKQHPVEHRTGIRQRLQEPLDWPRLPWVHQNISRLTGVYSGAT